MSSSILTTAPEQSEKYVYSCPILLQYLIVLVNHSYAAESCRRSDYLHEARALRGCPSPRVRTKPWRYLCSRCFDLAPSCSCRGAENELDTYLIGTSSARLFIQKCVREDEVYEAMEESRLLRVFLKTQTQ